MPVQIIPVDVVKGTNIIEREDAKFPWFEGRPLATIMHNDQERTHFDEEQYRKLADQPFEFEPYAVGTYNGSKILEGRVVRKSSVCAKQYLIINYLFYYWTLDLIPLLFQVVR